MFYRNGVLLIKVLHCENGDCRPFRSCDLGPMTFIYAYELDPYYLEIYRMCKYERPTSKLSKVISSDIQTDKQTDTTEIIHHAVSRVVNYN